MKIEFQTGLIICLIIQKKNTKIWQSPEIISYLTSDLKDATYFRRIAWRQFNISLGALDEEVSKENVDEESALLPSDASKKESLEFLSPSSLKYFDENLQWSYIEALTDVAKEMNTKNAAVVCSWYHWAINSKIIPKEEYQYFDCYVLAKVFPWIKKGYNIEKSCARKMCFALKTCCCSCSIL